MTTGILIFIMGYEFNSCGILQLKMQGLGREGHLMHRWNFSWEDLPLQKGRWHSTIRFAWVFYRRHLLTFSAGAYVASLVALVQWPSYFWLGSFHSDLLPVYCMLQLPVDLERFPQWLHFSGIFVRDIWINFEVSILITAYLDNFSQTRLFISCLVIQVDRTDVALGATSIRLQCHSQPWIVPHTAIAVIFIDILFIRFCAS